MVLQSVLTLAMSGLAKMSAASFFGSAIPPSPPPAPPFPPSIPPAPPPPAAADDPPAPPGDPAVPDAPDDPAAPPADEPPVDALLRDVPPAAPPELAVDDIDPPAPAAPCIGTTASSLGLHATKSDARKQARARRDGDSTKAKGIVMGVRAVTGDTPTNGRMSGYPFSNRPAPPLVGASGFEPPTP